MGAKLKKAEPGAGTGGDHSGKGRDMAGGLGGEIGLERDERRRLQLVRLGEHEEIGDRALVEPVHHRPIRLHQAAPGIDQEEHAAQTRPAAQEPVGQPGPGLDHGLGRRGIAIARQIDEAEPATEIEEIDLLGAARCVRDAREIVAPDERVQQARLADIGATGKGDLGQAWRRQTVETERARDERAVLREENAPGF